MDQLIFSPSDLALLCQIYDLDQPSKAPQANEITNSEANTNDVVTESLEMTEIYHHEKLAEYETKLSQLLAELQKEKETVALLREKLQKEKKFTSHLQDKLQKAEDTAAKKLLEAKKELSSKNLNLRKEIYRLQEKYKSSEGDLNLFERMLGQKDRQLADNHREIQQLKNLLEERLGELCQVKGLLGEKESEIKELWDHLINVKVEMQKLLHNS